MSKAFWNGPYINEVLPNIGNSLGSPLMSVIFRAIGEVIFLLIGGDCLVDVSVSDLVPANVVLLMNNMLLGLRVLVGVNDVSCGLYHCDHIFADYGVSVY